MTPSLEAIDLPHAQYAVTRLIPASWREEIRVVAVGIGDEDSGRPGVPWVEIEADTDLAQHQAQLCIGPFVDNPVDDWLSGWQLADDGSARLRLWNPGTEYKEHLELRYNVA